MGGPSDGPYQGNPRFGSYDGETQNTKFYDTNHSNFPPPPPFIPLPPLANAYTSSGSPPHRSQDSRQFIHNFNVINLTRLSSVNHENRYAHSSYHPSHAFSANYNLPYLNNVRDGMGYIRPMHSYGNNSPQYPTTHKLCHVDWVIQLQTFLTQLEHLSRDQLITLLGTVGKLSNNSSSDLPNLQSLSQRQNAEDKKLNRAIQDVEAKASEL